jgi:ApaG protein
MRVVVISVLVSRRGRYNNRMDPENKYHITVSAKAFYVEDQSDPDKNHYVFGYTIKVTNTGTVPAQLVSRHWLITDSNHRVEEVRGLGVIGQQPTLQPGQSFEYTSGCPLATPVGTMRVPDGRG